MTPICEKKDRLLWWTRFETPNFFLKTCFRNSWFFLDRRCLNLFEWSCFQNSRWFLDRDNPNYSDALIFDTSNFYLTTMRYHFGLLVFFCWVHIPDDFDPDSSFPNNLGTSRVTTRRGYCDRYQNHLGACDHKIAELSLG